MDLAVRTIAVPGRTVRPYRRRESVLDARIVGCGGGMCRLEACQFPRNDRLEKLESIVELDDAGECRWLL